jgi:hypothetical protein
MQTYRITAAELEAGMSVVYDDTTLEIITAIRQDRADFLVITAGGMECEVSLVTIFHTPVQP